MDDLLREIKNVPAVIGSYIHVAGVTSIYSDLPKIFQSKVYDVGETVDRIIKVNEATKMHANNIEFKYDEALIVVRPIASDASLITFCETDINKKSLYMTTGMLSGELKAAAARIRAGSAPRVAPAAPEPIPAPPPKTPAAAQNIDVNKILHAGPLAKVFQDFQNAFAMAIGPIGEMIMKDTVKEWAKNGDCSGERLTELVDMLCREIDDRALESEFKDAIGKHLN
jgi:hypothetical protein